MQHIETVADVNQNGYVTIALPAHIRPGKHHILLVIDEALSEDDSQSVDHAPQLMQMAGRVSAFAAIETTRYCGNSNNVTNGGAMGMNREH